LTASALAALRCVFFVNGTLLGSFAAHLPLLRARLEIGDGVLGAALLAMAAGAVVTMLTAGPRLDRTGSKPGIITGAVLIVAALPWLAHSPGTPATMALMVIIGAGNGLMDVAMNTHGAALERQLERSVMSSLHAFFSLGGIAAAATTGALLGFGWSGGLILLLNTAAMAAALLAFQGNLLQRASENLEGAGSGLAWPRGPVMPLALLAAAAFISEGAMFDWSGVFLVEAHGSSAAIAAWGFAVFSGAMACMRLVGDRIIDRLGPRRVLAGSASLALSGYAVALAGPAVWSTLLGYALIGLGVANIIPILFAGAGRLPGVGRGAAIAAVATFGYGGILAGPALIGFLAELVDLRFALSCVASILVPLLIAALRHRII